MTDRPVVTVCIPTFNRRRLLSAALASVLEQSLQDIEVIVSDNASTDDTEEYVRSIDDPRVRYDRLPENIGLFGNLTRCLHLGTGRYRVMLPDDDLMLPGNLEAKAAFLDAHPSAGMVHSAFRYLDEEARPYGPPQQWTRLTGDHVLSGRDFIRRSIALGGIVCVSSVMTRSAVVAEERFDAEDGPYADIALWLRIATRSDVGFIDQPLSGYLVHNSSASAAGYSLMQVDGGRSTLSLHAADVTLRAHGRFVQQARLDEAERDELAELLRQADRRMRLSIRVNALVPPRVLGTVKRLAGWRPGGSAHTRLSMDGALRTAGLIGAGALVVGPAAAEPVQTEPVDAEVVVSKRIDRSSGTGPPDSDPIEEDPGT